MPAYVSDTEGPFDKQAACSSKGDARSMLNWASGTSLALFDRECPTLWRRDVSTYQYRCKECGKSFERTETITEHEAAKVRCPKCNSKKVTQVPGRVYVVTSKKS